MDYVADIDDPAFETQSRVANGRKSASGGMHYLNICADGRDKVRTKNENGKVFHPCRSAERESAGIEKLNQHVTKCLGDSIRNKVKEG